MDVCHIELDRRSVGSTSKPEVEILAVFTSFEEEDIVAGVEIGKAIEGRIVVVRGLRVEFRVLVGVRKEGVDVAEQVSVS